MIRIFSKFIDTTTRCHPLDIRDLTILGRQRDGDGQNKLLQINGIVKIVRDILSIVWI
jgi:hypothetical protein